jgi:hypothetical protein
MIFSDREKLAVRKARRTEANCGVGIPGLALKQRRQVK